MYFIRTSSASLPPSEAYRLFNNGVISLALMLCSTSRIVCKCASYHCRQPQLLHAFQLCRRSRDSAASPYLGPVRSIVYRHIQTPPQRTLGIAPAQQLPHLPIDLTDLGLTDLGLLRTECRGVEVDGGVLGEGVDVDGAPVVAEGGSRVLLDDRHRGGADDIPPYDTMLEKVGKVRCSLEAVMLLVRLPWAECVRLSGSLEMLRQTVTDDGGAGGPWGSSNLGYPVAGTR